MTIALCPHCGTYTSIEYLTCYFCFRDIVPVSSEVPDIMEPFLKISREMDEEMKSKREKLLEKALNAAKEVIDWYEDEHEITHYDAEDLPQDLVEAMNAFKTAEEKLKKLDKENK